MFRKTNRSSQYQKQKQKKTDRKYLQINHGIYRFYFC
jgi:hypothetical protein